MRFPEQAAENGDFPPETRHQYERYMLAEAFGWTLEYIDSLSQYEIFTLIEIRNQIAEFRADQANRRK